MLMTITIWIKESELEKFKKFYDDVNNERQIEKEDIPKIDFKTSKPVKGDYLQINIIHEIFYIMREMLEKNSN
ncbi:MAG TPA: hypothetical protein P5509_01220 [Bacteroidales bacterium]|nr:hypothetical protein [Bacteroidales bacterium]